jgi:hypothetical protein
MSGEAVVVIPMPQSEEKRLMIIRETQMLECWKEPITSCFTAMAARFFKVT